MTRLVEFYVLMVDHRWTTCHILLEGDDACLDDDAAIELARTRIEKEIEEQATGQVECLGPLYYLESLDGRDKEE